MSNFLEKLVANKKKEVAELKQRKQLLSVAPRVSHKSFKNALKKGHAVIAEIKRKSPSKSHIGEIPDPVNLAQRYAEGGAAAISVLTDAYGFDGSIEDLKAVAAALENTSVTVLRKDFIIDPIQICEAVLAGADAVLLIIAVLKEQTADLLRFAQEMGIDALVEVMNQEEMDYALSLSPDLIAVNNRDLKTFEVDMNRAFTLKKSIPESIISVAASGMDSPKIVSRYFAEGYNAVLVGEALVKAKDPVQFIRACQRNENSH